MAKRLITITSPRGKIEKIVEKDWIDSIDDSKQYNTILKAAIDIGLLSERYNIRIIEDEFEVEILSMDEGF